METQKLAGHAEDIRRQGYTVIPGYLHASEVASARSKLDALFQKESAWSLRNPYLRTPSHQMSHLLPLKDPFFLKLASHENLLPLIYELLGKDCLLSCMNGFTTQPGGEAQPLHLDQVESTPGTPVMLNALHVLDDFTKENGATRLVPGSHLERHARCPEDPAVEKEAIQIEAEAGSLLVFSAGLLHGGSKNKTLLPRRALHVCFCRSWIKPEWDFPRSAPRSVARNLKKSEKRLLGYYNRPNWYDGSGSILHAGLEKDPGFFWRQAWRDFQRFCR